MMPVLLRYRRRCTAHRAGRQGTDVGDRADPDRGIRRDYHPVGTAMLVALMRRNRGREIGINGMWVTWGRLAALLYGFLTAHFGWRAAFILPERVAILLGIGFSSARARETSPHPVGQGRGAWRGQRGSGRCAGVRRAGVGHRHRRVVFNASTVTYPKLKPPGAPERLAGVAADPRRGGQPGLCLGAEAAHEKRRLHKP